MTSKAAGRRSRSEARKQKRLLQNLLILGGVMLAIAAVIWLIQGRSAAADLGEMPTRRAMAGDPMPNVGWLGLDGKPVHVSDFAGQPLLINAWATWCPPCKAEMPLLDAFYQQYKDQGFVLLAVNAAEEQDVVSQFIQQSGFSFPVVRDQTGEALSRLGLVNFPSSILVGRDGLIKRIHVGMIEQRHLQEEIIPLLGLQ